MPRLVPWSAVLWLTAVSAGAADYHVDPASGVDAAGGGSATAPWKTLTYAAGQVRTTGDRILLAAGLYNRAGNGEVFPADLEPGVSLVGAGSDRTVLRLDAGDPATRLVRVRFPWGADLSAMAVEGIHFEAEPPLRGVGVVAEREDLSAATWDSVGPVIRDCHFSGLGSGVSLGGTMQGTYQVTVRRCRFEANRTGVYLRVSSFDRGAPVDTSRIENCLFLGNETGVFTQSIEGLRNSPSVRPRVANNTFVGQTNWGLYNNGVSCCSTPRVTGNIIQGSGRTGILDLIGGWGSYTANLFHDNAEGAFLYQGPTGVWQLATGAELNRLQGVDPAEANLDGDALFVDLAAGDLHLLPGSPATDRANDAFAPAEDFDGAARPFDGDGDGVPHADIGAYERQSVRRVQLVRGDLSRLDPPAPAVATFFPLDASNPANTVPIAAMGIGDSDPTPGILSRTDIPLALYGLDTPGAATLLLAKDVAGDTVGLHR